ncbi:tyrosine-protein phosphatase 10D isoform X2 [Folsomia candida]|uniref:tyrosine-protein phosphatase 10D isoform X2 n=1 Tax=Folsomia candida TaxID=158441 RepID=UPI0016050F09|nr:tyrosine-protein phosphatase 10D isoform X2 [Folsomia candida]
MHVQQVVKSEGMQMSNGVPDTIVDNPRISEGFVASFAFLVILITVTTICLSFIKSSFDYFTGRRSVNRTVQCTRISVISESGSSKPSMNFRFLSFNEFREYYKDLVSDSYYKLSLEFESLKVHGDEMIPCTEGDRGKNHSKNRFVNILPFDNTRVLLSTLEGVPFSDYINANYVSGYYSSDVKKEGPKHEYIATQGPLKNTIDDFWRLCWESKSKCIVMLTRLVDRDREKCAHYWPTSSSPVMYGEIEVEVLSESPESYSVHKWIVMEFKLRHKEQERCVRHYQFQTWPDFESVEPPEALVYFVREVRTYAPYPTLGKPFAPIIIHCSAGVGRTGTFIGVDIAMNQIKMNKAINIPSIVSKMRKERVWMVQTEQQYICIYKCAIAILDEIETVEDADI